MRLSETKELGETADNLKDFIGKPTSSEIMSMDRSICRVSSFSVTLILIRAGIIYSKIFLLPIRFSFKRTELRLSSESVHGIVET